jgi:hypothetical protein
VWWIFNLSFTFAYNSPALSDEINGLFVATLLRIGIYHSRGGGFYDIAHSGKDYSWNARRMKAAEQGVPFDEPPPPRPVSNGPVRPST